MGREKIRLMLKKDRCISHRLQAVKTLLGKYRKMNLINLLAISSLAEKMSQNNIEEDRCISPGFQAVKLLGYYIMMNTAIFIHQVSIGRYINGKSQNINCLQMRVCSSKVYSQLKIFTFYFIFLYFLPHVSDLSMYRGS